MPITLLFALLITLSANAYAQDTIVFTLEQCINKAVALSPEIAEQRYEEDVYKAKKMQVDGAAYPQIEILFIAGPSPKAVRDNLSPLINTSVNTSITGIFARTEATLIQPIYTFNKISSLNEAASSAIKAAQAGTNKKKSEVVLRTKEIYYGLLLALELQSLVSEIKDELVDSIKKAERHLEAGSPWADEVNIFKLKAFMGEVERNLNEAEKNILIAKDALRRSIGLPEGIDFDIADKSISAIPFVKKDVKAYAMQSLELRPEFIQLREGLNARNFLIEAEKSNYYPQLFAGIKAVLADSTNRDRIKNPYISDYFRESYGAAFLGFKWNIDFGMTKGRVKEAEAEYYKLTEKKRFADEAIPFQATKAYFDLRESEKNIAELVQAYINAKKWLVSAVANFDLGLVDAKEVADSVLIYAQTRASYLKSLYNQQISYANLLNASGADLKELSK
jgi:outer membrane protein TolC